MADLQRLQWNVRPPSAATIGTAAKHRADHGRVDNARRHRIAPDEGRKVGSKRFREADQPGLGRGMGRNARRIGQQGLARGDVDDGIEAICEPRRPSTALFEAVSHRRSISRCTPPVAARIDASKVPSRSSS